MVVAGDVADREHARHTRLERGPHRDPAALIEARPGHDLHGGLCPDAHHRDVGVDPLPALGDDAFEPSVSLEPLDRVVEVHRHPVIAMDRLEHATDLGPEDPIQGGLEDLDDRYVAPHRSQGRSDLSADPVLVLRAGRVARSRS